MKQMLVGTLGTVKSGNLGNPTKKCDQAEPENIIFNWLEGDNLRGQGEMAYTLAWPW